MYNGSIFYPATPPKCVSGRGYAPFPWQFNTFCLILAMFNKPPYPVGVDKRELQSRLYSRPDVLSSTKPVALTAVQKLPAQNLKALQLRKRDKLEPLPALSAYQKKKNEQVLKFEDVHSETDVTKEHLEERSSFLRTPSLPEVPQHALITSPSRFTDSFQLKRRQSSFKQSALFLNTDPSLVITKYHPPLEHITDPLEIIERLKKEPELGFLYLTAVGNSSHYNPYNLRYCNYIFRH